MFFKEEHTPNAYSPILVTEFGMITEIKPSQAQKAYSPMLVTDLPIVTEVKPEHSEKAYSPMLVTEFGMVMEVKPEQPKKAPVPMLVTELGIMVFLHPAIKVLLLFSIMALLSSRESYISLSEATDIDSKHEQPKKAPPPMLFTELPIVTEVKPLHPEYLLLVDYQCYTLKKIKK